MPPHASRALRAPLSLCLAAVSYTHLDVYKRQCLWCARATGCPVKAGGSAALRCCSATTARGKAPPRRASSANSNRSRSIIGRRDRPENIAARGKGSGMLSDAIAT